MADYDQGNPADDDLLSQYPQNERDARDAVRANFTINHHAEDDDDVGKHEVVELLANATPSAVAGQGNFYTKDVGSGEIELFHQDEDGNETQLTDRGTINDIPIGTKCVFYQSSAPTGWTQDTSINDQVLRTVSGSGGGTGGTNGIAGLSTEGHALTISEMPSHNHGGGNHAHNIDTHEQSSGNDHRQGNEPPGLGSSLGQQQNGSAIKNSGTIINSNGGDSAHSHNIDPKYIDVIVATKD